MEITENSAFPSEKYLKRSACPPLFFSCPRLGQTYRLVGIGKIFFIGFQVTVCFNGYRITDDCYFDHDMTILCPASVDFVVFLHAPCIINQKQWEISVSQSFPAGAVWQGTRFQLCREKSFSGKIGVSKWNHISFGIIKTV